ncbi:MAG: nucleotidyltransferase family protein [Sphaerobacteraceae bacterium]|nr:MAG: nucleotidyltransferase family protein [Sphaerobacteraceae bacterium]
MSNECRIAAVVLAAGGSTRLGHPKQLLQLGERVLIDHTLSAVRRAGHIDDYFIILGHAEDDIRAQSDLTGFTQISNSTYSEGQSTSVRIAIEQIPEAIDAAVFVLADQPLQVPDVIERLAASYRENPAPIIQPVYADGPGNPVLISRDVFPDLAHLTGDTGARPVLKRRKAEIRKIDCSEWSRPLDVDTVEDYERIKQQYELGELDQS